MMDTKVKKLIICHRIYHQKTCIERFYVKRENGGRDLIQLELTYKTITVGF